jgi:cytochrome c-type biogenesis protein CcmF
LLKIPLIIAIAAGLLFSFMQPFWSWQAAAGLMMASWITVTAVLAIKERFKGRSIASGLRSTPRGFWGMILGHIGIASFIIGVTLVSIYNIEKDLRMKPGDTFELSGYTFKFNGVRTTRVDNYQAARGDFVVTDNNGFKAEMKPEKRIYLVQKNPMTEAAIDAALSRDLFIALGEEIDTDGSWAIRIYYKPFIRFIWLGGIIMALGGLLAGTDKRYRLMAKRDLKISSQTAGSAA